MVFGQPVYNTEQRRAILGDIKQYFARRWKENMTRRKKALKRKKIVPRKKRIKRKKNNLRLHYVKIKRRRRRRR